jgi:hypothetical protein
MSTSASKKVTELHAIRLTAAQFTRFSKSRIHIFSPDGDFLACIGKSAKDVEAEYLRNQLALIESLSLNASGFLELTEKAAMGLAETLAKAQEIIGDRT